VQPLRDPIRRPQSFIECREGVQRALEPMQTAGDPCAAPTRERDAHRMNGAVDTAKPVRESRAAPPKARMEIAAGACRTSAWS